MFALLKLNNIGEKVKIEEKLQDYSFIGAYESLNEIEKEYLNYFAHKYRLKDYNWCYFCRRPGDWNRDIDSHLLADMVIIDLNFDKEYLFDYQTNLKSYNIKEILREIKLTMIL